jgi:MSHA pilin protein MshD
VLLLVNQNASHSADPLIQRQALAIAESYLEEIRLKAYLDPDSAAVCPAPEASRADYDNVCDYAGLSDSGAQDQSGTAISGLSAYSVQVTVDQSATLHTLSGSGAVLKIMVNVSHDSGIAVALAAYRTDY